MTLIAATLRPEKAKLAAIGLAISAAASIIPAAEATEPDRGLSVSASLDLVSDYRARGLTYSDNAAALQASAEVDTDSGWSLGVWSSTLGADGADADVEVDVYASKTFNLGGTELGLGATWIFYPDTDDLDYGEAAVTVARSFGGADWSAGVNYVWEQAGSGQEANTYVFSSVTTPAGEVAGAPVSLTASLGYEDGAFAVEGEKLDWALGVAVDVVGVTVSGSYVGTDIDDDLGSDGVVFSISKAF